MALTEAQKTSVREYLGWSARFGQHDSALERAMSAISSFPSEEARLIEHLAELARIDAAITAAEARFKADQVGTITLAKRELGQLRSRGEERVGRLATQLGVEVRNSPFAASLPRWRASFGGPVGGGNAQMEG